MNKNTSTEDELVHLVQITPIDNPIYGLSFACLRGGRASGNCSAPCCKCDRWSDERSFIKEPNDIKTAINTTEKVV